MIWYRKNRYASVTLNAAKDYCTDNKTYFEGYDKHFDHMRHYPDHYNHQVVDHGNAHFKDYFHISAPDRD